MASRGADTKLIDLGGKCLTPGFVDPHSHIVMQSVKFSTANLDPKPIGEAGSIADIQRILREWIETKQIEPGKWVIGWGYDDTGIEEQRHPNRDDLDAVSTEHPILLMHISSHLMTGNSKMLEEIGINAETKNPDGGKIQRKAGSNEPSGVLEELAMMLVVKKLPMPTPEKAMAMLEEGMRFYAQAGITTAQDCASGKGALKILEAMEQQGKLPIDIITWPLYKGVDNAEFDAIVADRGKRGRLRRGGVKVTLDGSIQGYTAFLSEPYHVQPGDTEPTADKCVTDTAEHIFVSADTESHKASPHSKPEGDYRGYSNMTQEEVETWLKRCDEADAAWQNREEDRKGTLETGKLADLVVLSDDPLAVDPMKIKDIQVVETIKEGQFIYKAES